MKKKSVQSINPPLIAGQACKSLPVRQAGVIQTSYDIVKAHGGVPIAIGMKVETE